MSVLPGRLGSLTAHDVMTEKLVLLRESDTIHFAANLFREHRISGAPVVNDQGGVVGLLSVTDIIPTHVPRLRDATPRRAHPSRQAEWDELCAMLGTEGGEDGPLLGDEPVGARMTRRIVSVRQDTPLIEVARVMCDGHWHRLTVIDAEGKLCGIVSTMDLLAALVQTHDEVCVT